MAEEEIKIGDEGIFETISDFRQLYQILKNEEEIIGSSGEGYDAEYLIGVIDQFRSRLKKLQQKANFSEVSDEVIKRMISEDAKLMEQIHHITREEKLRFKVVELAVKEAINRAVIKKPAIDLSHDTVITKNKENESNQSFS